MLRKIYRELVRIRKELHAIRSNMESCGKSVTANTAQTANSRKFEVRTNIDDYPTAEHTGKVNTVLNDLTSRRYRGV